MRVAWPVALGLGAALMLLHLACIGGYGYFRDELYYLACAQRLDWGYVDQPPLSIALLRLTTHFFGDGLWALRLPTVLAGVATLWLIMAMTARLGGDTRAQALAGLAFAAAPVYRVVNHLYSMNGLDVMFWSLAGLLFIKILQENRRQDYVLIGIVVGFALMNKLSALWLCGALVLGLVVSDRRDALRGPWPYVAAALAALLSLPHVTWQIGHDWPTRDFVENANRNKLLPTNPFQFIATQIFVMNPATLPVWLGGLVVSLRKKEWRPFGYAFLAVALLLMINGRSRENYLAPAYPLILAPGAVWLVEYLGRRWTTRPFRRWEPRPIGAYFGALGAAGFATAVLALPLLPLDVIARFLQALPVEPPATERGEKSPIQGFGDMVGWQEMAEKVAEEYRKLPPEERKHAAILVYNYGEAAALERYGKAYGLPTPISTHNNYWIWGPRGWDGRVALLFGQIPESQLAQFRNVRNVGQMDVPLAMPEEGRAIIRIGRDLKTPVPEFWAASKRLE